MTKWMKAGAAIALCSAALCARADAQADARVLLDAAVAEVKTAGMEVASQSFNAGGKWNKGSAYVVMGRFDGTMLAHSANDKMAGKNMLEAKDATGKAFVQEAIATAQAGKEGRIPMRWANPATKQMGDAVFVVRKVPGQDAYIGSVAFK